MTTIAFIGFARRASPSHGGLSGRNAARLAAYDLRFNDPAASTPCGQRAANSVSNRSTRAGIASGGCRPVARRRCRGPKAVAASAAPDLSGEGSSSTSTPSGRTPRPSQPRAIATGKGQLRGSAVMRACHQCREGSILSWRGKRCRSRLAGRLNALVGIVNLEAVGDTPGPGFVAEDDPYRYDQRCRGPADRSSVLGGAGRVTSHS